LKKRVKSQFGRMNWPTFFTRMSSGNLSGSGIKRGLSGAPRLWKMPNGWIGRRHDECTFPQGLGDFLQMRRNGEDIAHE